ncbi:MAG: ribbon-helix-helix protein, CopG family [Nitrosopumilales archaeon]|nr:ribbon-helix-helix protein, CopG family [Nitrosopumilales archaeon]
MTFRLDENVIATLSAQCERRHISLSAMINQILR